MSDQRIEPLLPPTDPDSEPTDANPVPLSPTDPKRRTSTGDTAAPDEVERPAIPVVPAPGGSPGTGARPAAIPLPVDRTPERDDPSVRPDSEGAV